MVPEEVADFDILFSTYARAKANKTQSTAIYSLCICRSLLETAAEISLPLAQGRPTQHNRAAVLLLLSLYYYYYIYLLSTL